jgi:hypothetical protein
MPPVSNVFQECPHEHDQWSSLRGDQPQRGQWMRGPKVSPLLSMAGSRSVMGETGHILGYYEPARLISLENLNAHIPIQFH